MTMEIQAQERLNTLFGLDFYLIQKEIYHQYRQEAENAKDIISKEKRYNQMINLLKDAIEQIDVDLLFNEHFTKTYLQKKTKELFTTQDVSYKNVRAMYQGKLNILGIWSSENWLNKEDAHRNLYYLEKYYLSYIANQITKEFWFYDAYYNFSHEFLDTLKAQLPPMEAVLMMESKYLLPMYLGDDHLTKKESLSMDEYEADENSMVKFWRMSDELVNYLYRKLTENPAPYQGLINEDYQLFVEMLRKAKEEDCYFVLDFL